MLVQIKCQIEDFCLIFDQIFYRALRIFWMKSVQMADNYIGSIVCESTREKKKIITFCFMSFKILGFIRHENKDKTVKQSNIRSIKRYVAHFIWGLILTFSMVHQIFMFHRCGWMRKRFSLAMCLNCLHWHIDHRNRIKRIKFYIPSFEYLYNTKRCETNNA